LQKPGIPRLFAFVGGGDLFAMRYKLFTFDLLCWLNYKVVSPFLHSKCLTQASS
jgi:hypothetical protein